MPRGAPRSQGSSGEVISHFSHMRIRVVGAGNLVPTFNSMQDVRSKQLVPLQLTTKTNIAPTRLVNFNEQRASLHLGTTSINDYFRVNRIIIYTKFLASEYPA